jgi:hypothetical protein
MRLSKAVPRGTGAPTLFATDLLFVYVYCRIDDAIKTGALDQPT